MMNLRLFFLVATQLVWSMNGHDLLTVINRGNLVELELYLKKTSTEVNERNEHGETALHHAAHKGLLSVAELLVNAGASPFALTHDGATPLLIACFYNHAKVVDYLFRKAPSTINIPNSLRLTPLHALVTFGQTNLVKKMVSQIAEPHMQEYRGITPLMAAVHQQRKDIVQLLLPYYVGHLDKADTTGRTALFASIHNNNIELADALIRHGANINHMSNDGTTPLLLATEKNLLGFCNFLVTRNAEREATNALGENALIISVKQNNMRFIRFFTAGSRQINHQDKGGLSALEHAIRNNNIEAVLILLEHPEILPHMRNSLGQNAYEVALEMNNDAITQALNQHNSTSATFPLHDDQSLFNDMIEFDFTADPFDALIETDGYFINE